MTVARKVEPWDEEQAAEVVTLLQSFNDKDAVAAVMDVPPSALDRLCEEAFGCDFEHAQAKNASIGRAKLRSTLYEQAVDGNAKALDMLAREQLNMDPVKRRTAPQQKPKVQLEL